MTAARQPRSILGKVTRVILGVLVVAILPSTIALGIADRVRGRADLRASLQTLADITATNSTAALAFGDREAAGDVLRSLRAQPGILTAALYASDGSLFSEYARPGTGLRSPSRLPDATAPEETMMTSHPSARSFATWVAIRSMLSSSSQACRVSSAGSPGPSPRIVIPCGLLAFIKK